MDHSKHSWMSNKSGLGPLSNGEQRKPVDKDNLTPEQRRRVDEYKENLTYGVERDPFYD